MRKTLRKSNILIFIIIFRMFNKILCIYVGVTIEELYQHPRAALVTASKSDHVTKRFLSISDA